jgi:glutamine amidotransferase-like uncharacterized protein
MEGFLSMREGTMKRKNKHNMMPVTRIILIISVAIFLCINPFQQKVYALNGADIALYNDSIAPSAQSGVWQDGITAIKSMLTTKGFTYEEITYKDLNESTQNFSNLYKVILIPGGYAWWYNYWISNAGKTRIRNFIYGGGGYLGICAGAYFASDTIVFDGVTYGDNAGYNAYGELTGYDLNLFSGTGVGSITEIAKYPAYAMTTINFQTENSVLKNYKQIPYTENMLYYGGPYFTGTGSAEILGTYNVNGYPAIVAFNYGSGRVVLSGPHPETGGYNWDLAKYILNWLVSSLPPSCPDLYSWNGSEYLNNGSIYKGTHSPEQEYYQERLVTQPVVEQNNTLTFKIKEVDNEISYTNSMAMYYRNSGNAWTELELISAVHNKAGDVREALTKRDDNRAYTAPGDEILLTYRVPPGGVEKTEFKSVSSGYYLWSKERWCEVLNLGPAFIVQPGVIATLQARINNMSASELPDDARVYFNIWGPGGYSSNNIFSVTAGSLAPATPKWYSLNWTVPDDAPAGQYY